MSIGQTKELIRTAILARKNSYSPYSKFKVGAALLAGSGKIYSGTNIECSSFSLTICAERVAYAKAISEGERDFTVIAIATSKKDFIFPCGACRQFMKDFSGDLKVILIKSPNEFKTFKLSELLPKSFKLIL